MAVRPPDTTYQMVFPSDAISFDADKFDELIHSHGVEMVHYRGMRCPVGMIDPNDIRRPHEHHENCSNGFIYTRAGIVTVGFLGNSSNVQYMDAGRMNGSTVQVIIPRFYDSSEERANFTNFDRVYLKEESITVTNWQTFSAHITGVDRLDFPVIEVIDLMDSQGVRYNQGDDFVVKNGQIHWIGNKKPGVDPKSGKGRVCSVRYSYRPYWYIKSLMHEVRVSRIEDPFTGERRIERMPQSALLQREYHFEKEQNDPQATTQEAQQDDPNAGLRQQPGPATGLFGPR